MTKLKDLIVTTELENSDASSFIMGNPAFKTKDNAFIRSEDEIKKELLDSHRIILPSDYALAHHLETSALNYGKKGQINSCVSFLRSAYNDRCVDAVLNDGSLSYTATDDVGFSTRIALNLNLSEVLKIKQQSENFFNIKTVKSVAGIVYHTIDFGEYPQDKAKNSDELEHLVYGQNSPKLSLTGKMYYASIKGPDSYSLNDEYEYMGKRYVRAVATKYDESTVYKDGTSVEDGPVWFEVKPIKWKILNYEDLPKELNPNGTGRAKTLFIETEDGIIPEIPFNTTPSFYKTINDNITLWQNSVIRAYLNGYDLSMEIRNGNGNKDFISPINYDFKGRGFINEALDMDIVLNKTSQQQNETELAENKTTTTRKNRLEKLNPDKSPESSLRKMTDTEVIKNWIDAGQSVLLRGPSGIGKTERLKRLYPDLIYIKLTNNMFPEKVVGSINLQTGQPIPPDFAKQALLACANDEERKLIAENIQNLYELADTIYERSKTATGKVVIMLDELLNVKPAVQSLVYTLVLNRLVETGKGLKLPANTVIVATGNQKKYSSVAEDLAEPLEKRFDHILDMEPNVGQWLYEFAIPNNLHPSVIGYIFSKYQEYGRSEDIDNMGYFYEEPEIGENNLDKNGCRGRTNDPRGWESISRSLYTFEEDLKNGKFVGKNVKALLKTTLSSKLRDEWAEEFYDFYINPTLSVEEVVEKQYTPDDYPTNINEKFALIAGLLSASLQQVKECREFIHKTCGAEYLTVYDIYWAGNDEQRMEKIAELQELLPSTSNGLEQITLEPTKKRNYKITVDDFWNSYDTLAIRCDTHEKARLLLYVFTIMGKSWADGDLYTDADMWDCLESNTCYTNSGEYSGCGGWADAMYEFEEVDLEKYLTTEKEKKALYKILNSSQNKNAQREV